jgi:hypothetical protein
LAFKTHRQEPNLLSLSGFQRSKNNSEEHFLSLKELGQITGTRPTCQALFCPAAKTKKTKQALQTIRHSKEPGTSTAFFISCQGLFQSSSKRTKKICRPLFAYRSADTIELPLYKKTLPIVKKFFGKP